MAWSKYVSDGYIVAVGPGDVGIPLEPGEYDKIMEAMAEKPEPVEGYGLRLRADYVWERYEINYKEDANGDL